MNPEQDKDTVPGAAVAAVICAAGGSKRMGGAKKEYRPLPGVEGLTVLGAAVSSFAAVPEISVIVITVPEDTETGEAAARKALPDKLLSGETGTAIHFVSGGKTRSASVYNALKALSAFSSGYVLIHDGARPWVSPFLIRRVIAGVKKYRAVVPLVPVTETPKETDAPLANACGGDPVCIKQHLRRALVGAAQTPQAFAFPEILSAHEKAAQENLAGFEYTDDAEIWASFCGPVMAIPGEPENRKITFPEDLPC